MLIQTDDRTTLIRTEGSSANMRQEGPLSIATAHTKSEAGLSESGSSGESSKCASFSNFELSGFLTL